MTEQIKFMKLDNTKMILQNYLTQPNGPNYAEALRQLKNADAQIEKKKKQLRVQAMKAHRGNWMEQETQHKLQLRKESQASTEKLLKEFESLKMKELQKVEELRKKSQKSKQQSFKNRQRSRLEALQNKIKMNQEIRLKSQQHGERIKQFYHHLVQKNKNKCHQLYNSRKLSRMHIDSFQQSRMIQIRSVKSRQRDDILQRLKKRQKQLEKLDQDSLIQVTIDKRNQPSTSDIKSMYGSRLPYSQVSSSHLKNRKKCISQSKMDCNRIQLLALS